MAASNLICITPTAQQLSVQTSIITQSELGLLLSLKDRARQLAEQVEAEELSIRTRLEVGSEVEKGLLKACLKTTERRSVAWKVVCERELGESYCRRVLAATRPDSYTSLVVSA